MVIKCNWFWQHFLRQFGNLPIQVPGMVQEKTNLGLGSRLEQGKGQGHGQGYSQGLPQPHPNVVSFWNLPESCSSLAPTLSFPGPCHNLAQLFSPTLPQTCRFPFLLPNFRKGNIILCTYFQYKVHLNTYTIPRPWDHLNSPPYLVYR